MNRYDRTLTFFAFIGFVVLLARLVAGCALLEPDPQRQTADQVKNEARYTNRLFECVAEAGTLAESKACRATVNKEFGVVMKEAGR